MGLRKLKGRLDQLQAKGNLTMDEARAGIREARDALANVADGAILKAKPLPGFAAFLAKLLMTVMNAFVKMLMTKTQKLFSNKPMPEQTEEILAKALAWMEELDEFPIAAVYDLDYDNFPTKGEKYKLQGGSNDGDTWVPRKDRQLVVNFVDGTTYAWDGYQMPFVEPEEK